MYLISHVKQRHFKDAINRNSNIFFPYFHQQAFTMPLVLKG